MDICIFFWFIYCLCTIPFMVNKRFIYACIRRRKNKVMRSLKRDQSRAPRLDKVILAWRSTGMRAMTFWSDVETPFHYLISSDFRRRGGVVIKKNHIMNKFIHSHFVYGRESSICLFGGMLKKRVRIRYFIFVFLWWMM